MCFYIMLEFTICEILQCSLVTFKRFTKDSYVFSYVYLGIVDLILIHTLLSKNQSLRRYNKILSYFESLKLGFLNCSSSDSDLPRLWNSLVIILFTFYQIKKQCLRSLYTPRRTEVKVSRVYLPYWIQLFVMVENTYNM